jgi:hypothetical protein
VVLWQNSLSSVENYVKGILHTTCTSRVAKPDLPKPLWYDNRIFTEKLSKIHVFLGHIHHHLAVVFIQLEECARRQTVK